jgi:hypothetical protein
METESKEEKNFSDDFVLVESPIFYCTVSDVRCTPELKLKAH